MKLKIATIAFIALSIANLTGSFVYARGNFGLGLLLFGPSSISMQNYFDANTSIDAALGWDFNRTNGVYLHSTYLSHMHNQFHIANHPFDLFYGVGAYIHNAQSDSNFGCRVPIGAAYQVKPIPIEAFGEISANLNLIPKTEVVLMVGLGGRYYF
jgi:hypothetical protein